MADKQKYISNAKMKDTPKKPFKLLIGDKVVKTKHIDDKAVTGEKMDDNSVSNRTIVNRSVTESKMSDNSVSRRTIQNSSINNEKLDNDAVENRNIKDKNVSWDKLDDNVQNIVATGGGQHGIPLATEFGNSDIIGITQKTLTESRDNLQAQIDEIVSGEASVALSASPSPVNIGAENDINLTATSSKNATSIKIKKGDVELATGSGKNLTVSDEDVTISLGSTLSYTADFAYGGVSRSTTIKPLFFGSGAVATVDASTIANVVQKAVLKSSPAGTYNVTVNNNGDYTYFSVPSTMTIHGATMSGFSFPLEAPTNVTIDNVTYKSYRSSNTYDAGVITIVLS